MAKSASRPVYRRVIVKVSGEALSGPEGFGIHQPTIDRIAKDLVAAHKLGIKIGVVVERRLLSARRPYLQGRAVAAPRRRHGHARHRGQFAGA